jgi:hypothetical protein
MKWLRHIPALILLIVGAVLLNYYLPDRDIVQIVGTEVKRIDVESGAPFWDRADIGTVEGATRDVRFINLKTEKRAFTAMKIRAGASRLISNLTAATSRLCRKASPKQTINGSRCGTMDGGSNCFRSSRM